MPGLDIFTQTIAASLRSCQRWAGLRVGTNAILQALKGQNGAANLALTDKAKIRSKFSASKVSPPGASTKKTLRPEAV